LPTVLPVVPFTDVIDNKSVKARDPPSLLRNFGGLLHSPAEASAYAKASADK
jgi:hypothetical protein